jgi:hypothetical protein
LIASAIPANLALPLPRDCYFPVGDTDALASQLKAYSRASAARRAQRRAVREAIQARYSWRRAAELTSSVYRYVARLGWVPG